MKAVLITTEFRGVFFGYLENDRSRDDLPDEITLKNGRNCVHWDSAVNGVFGLASVGPNDLCRVGPKVPEITLYKVTSISEVEEVAVEKWEKGPWS